MRFEFYSKVEQLKKQLNTVIHGKEDVVDLLLTVVLCGGNILLDDVPGVGKTTLAKALALSIDAAFKRIQFTPDLLPSDILGSSVYNQKESVFTFYKGPVFSNIILADEINRASPRTQAALLEAMNEKQVSIEGNKYELPNPFMVIATENPIEYYGTFPLPEAQLDRFTMKFSIGYPDEKAELDMLYTRRKNDPLESVKPVISGNELSACRLELPDVETEQTVLEYILSIIRATRMPESGLRLGASPRAFLTLVQCGQAYAWLNKRDYVTPDDVRLLVKPVLSHRVLPDAQARHAGQTALHILDGIVRKIRIPD